MVAPLLLAQIAAYEQLYLRMSIRHGTGLKERERGDIFTQLNLIPSNAHVRYRQESRGRIQTSDGVRGSGSGSIMKHTCLRSQGVLDGKGHYSQLEVSCNCKSGIEGKLEPPAVG